MNILEKDIEEILYEYIDDKETMKEHGFWCLEQKYYRQVNLGVYGIADIIGVSFNKIKSYRILSVTIYELKKDYINIDTLIQAARYVKAIERIFNNKNKELLKISKINVRIVLIGREIEIDSDFVFLADFIDDVYLYTYSLDFISGLRFNSHKGFFKTGETELDFTKYLKDIREGQWHGKASN